MYEIATLKTKKLPELQEIAKKIGIKRIAGQKKLDLIYQIVDFIASQPDEEEQSKPKIEKKASDSEKKAPIKVLPVQKSKPKPQKDNQHQQKNNNPNQKKSGQNQNNNNPNKNGSNKRNDNQNKNRYDHNHNKDNRSRYRQPDFEFDAIIESEGVFDVMSDGYGFLRSSNDSYVSGPDDIDVSPNKIRRFNLATGDVVTGKIRAPKKGEKYFALVKVSEVNEDSPENIRNRIPFSALTPLHPNQRLGLELGNGGTEDITARVIDLVEVR